MNCLTRYLIINNRTLMTKMNSKVTTYYITDNEYINKLIHIFILKIFSPILNNHTHTYLPPPTHTPTQWVGSTHTHTPTHTHTHLHTHTYPHIHT